MLFMTHYLHMLMWSKQNHVGGPSHANVIKTKPSGRALNGHSFVMKFMPKNNRMFFLILCIQIGVFRDVS